MEEPNSIEWKSCRKRPVIVHYREAVPGERIATREGELVAREGDLIIRGIKGELYPIGREIFEQTYEDPGATRISLDELHQQVTDRVMTDARFRYGALRIGIEAVAALRGIEAQLEQLRKTQLEQPAEWIEVAPLSKLVSQDGTREATVKVSTLALLNLARLFGHEPQLLDEDEDDEDEDDLEQPAEGSEGYAAPQLVTPCCGRPMDAGDGSCLPKGKPLPRPAS